MESNTDHFAAHRHASPGSDLDDMTAQFSSAARRARNNYQQTRALRGRRPTGQRSSDAQQRRAQTLAKTWPIADLAARWAATRQLAEEARRDRDELHRQRDDGHYVSDKQMSGAEEIVTIRQAHFDAWDSWARESGIDTSQVDADLTAAREDGYGQGSVDGWRDGAAAQHDLDAGAHAGDAERGWMAEAAAQQAATGADTQPATSPEAGGERGWMAQAAAEASTQVGVAVAEELTDHYLDDDPFAAQAPPGRRSVNDLIADSDLAAGAAGSTAPAAEANVGWSVGAEYVPYVDAGAEL